MVISCHYGDHARASFLWAYLISIVMMVIGPIAHLNWLVSRGVRGRRQHRLRSLIWGVAMVMPLCMMMAMPRCVLIPMCVCEERGMGVVVMCIWLWMFVSVCFGGKVGGVMCVGKVGCWVGVCV